MLALIVAFSTTGMFVALHLSDLTKFKISAFSARKIYLLSLAGGVFFFNLLVLVNYIIELVSHIFLHDNFAVSNQLALKQVSSIFSENPPQKVLFIYSLSCVLLPVLSTLFLNFILYLLNRTLASIESINVGESDYESKIRAKYYLALKRFDDEFECLLIESIYRDLPISVSLENNKVYIGYVRERPDYSSQRKYLKLLPLASGYRDEKLNLNLEVDYTPLIEAYKNTLTSNATADDDFEIIIKSEKIVSVNLFSTEAYVKQDI